MKKHNSITIFIEFERHWTKIQQISSVFINNTQKQQYGFKVLNWPESASTEIYTQTKKWSSPGLPSSPALPGSPPEIWFPTPLATSIPHAKELRWRKFNKLLQNNTEHFFSNCCREFNWHSQAVDWFLWVILWFPRGSYWLPPAAHWFPDGIHCFPWVSIDLLKYSIDFLKESIDSLQESFG